MSETLIKRSIEILGKIYAQNNENVTTINTIFELTGIKNKNAFILAYRHLQYAKLIRLNKIKGNKQKRVMVLTELGRSFIELKTDVYQYNYLYNDLKQQVKQRFSPKYQSESAKNKTVKNILLPQIEDNTKNSEYKEPFRRIYLTLFQLSPQHNIDTIFIRYIALLSRRALTRNKPARDILNKIMIDVLFSQMALIQRKELAEYTTIDKEPFPKYLALNKCRILLMLSTIAKLTEIKDIDMKVKDVMLSILNIIKITSAEIPIQRDVDVKIADALQEEIHALGEQEPQLSK